MGRPLVPEDIRDDRPRDVVHRAMAAHFLAYTYNRNPDEFVGDDLPAQLLLRAASAPATTSTTGWAAELAATAVADVISALAPASAAAALIQRGMRVGLDNSSA